MDKDKKNIPNLDIDIDYNSATGNKKTPLSKLLAVGIALFLVFVVLLIVSETTRLTSTASLHIEKKPTSTDPSKSEIIYNQLAFSSAHIPNIIYHPPNYFKGILFESWRSINKNQTWVLRIRGDLKFDNGDPITTSNILSSWKRLALINNRKGFKNIFNYIKDAKSIKNTHSKSQGIFSDGSHIIINFTKPIPGFLKELSRTIYSISHPSLYNNETGDWINHSKLISSGAYKVSSRTDKSLELKVRDDYPEKLIHPYRFGTINISWEKKSKKAPNITYGPSYKENKYNYVHHKGSKKLIAYAYCKGWRDPKSLCSSATSRKILRNEFYKELKNNKFTPYLSIFPKTIEGVYESYLPEMKTNMKYLKGKKLTYKESTLLKNLPIAKVFQSSLKMLAKHLGVKSSINRSSKRASDIELKTLSMSQIELETSPDKLFIDDSGVIIDTNGKLKKELSRTKINFGKINDIIWNQSIIWPITSYSDGVWTHPDIDFSIEDNVSFNFILIGRK